MNASKIFIKVVSILELIDAGEKCKISRVTCNYYTSFDLEAMLRCSLDLFCLSPQSYSSFR